VTAPLVAAPPKPPAPPVESELPPAPPAAALVAVCSWLPLLAAPPVALLVPPLEVLSMEIEGVEPVPVPLPPMTRTVAVGVTDWLLVWVLPL